MSLRGGHFVNFAGEFRLWRFQDAGPDNLNIPATKIEELGLETSIATVYDTPDLSWTATSLDFTPRLEAVLTRVNPDAISAHQAFDFVNNKPIDIVSPWKGRYGTFLSLNGVIVPYLLLEQMTYRASVRQNATKQMTLRGDAIYYCQRTPYSKIFDAATVAGAGVGPYAFDHAAVKTVESGVDGYAYCVTLHHNDGTWSRLRHGTDYTDTSVHFTLADVPAATDVIEVVYASATQRSLPDADAPDLDDVPAALRARDVEIIVSDGSATPQFFTWKGVQSVEAGWRVTLDPDEELGNPYYVDRDYDTPDVTGSVGLRPIDGAAFFSKLAQLQGVEDPDQTLSVNEFHAVDLEIRFNHPSTGSTIQTVVCEDARFTPPAAAARTGQKSEFTLNWTSETGSMQTYAGTRP